MKRFLLALALLLISSGAFAQCNGIFANGTVCGNNTGTSNTPRAVSPASLLGAAGGTNGQVQVNSAGILAGLTNTQLTADINLFTTGLSGATPASGGGTTNFLRADGTFAVPPGITSGTVTSVTCGTGLSGGTFTTTGTCAVSLTTASNSLGADVAMNNTSNYFDGPSTAQGTSGTWLATGTITFTDPTNPSNVDCKLWDGTTVIASTEQRYATAATGVSIALSGSLATPAANIRISCKSNSTTAVIAFNKSGNSKDSTLTVIRTQ